MACDPRDTDLWSLRFPKLIVEVLSPSTSRIDRTEKLNNYTTIPSLEGYLLVDQDQPLIILHRRRTDWTAETTIGLDTAFHLESIPLTVTMAQMYEGVSGM